jgi:hypothetical protein
MMLVDSQSATYSGRGCSVEAVGRAAKMRELGYSGGNDGLPPDTLFHAPEGLRHLAGRCIKTFTKEGVHSDAPIVVKGLGARVVQVTGADCSGVKGLSIAGRRPAAALDPRASPGHDGRDGGGPSDGELSQSS